jgi:basic amino acid/polyamine antiporter, APA family
VVMGAYYHVVGRDFNNAVAIVANLDKNPFPAGSSMLFFAGLCSGSPVLNLLMSLSNFLWFYLLLFIMAQVCIRNMFAWAFDRLLPSWLTRLSQKHGSPWAACLVTALLAELFLLLHGFKLMGFINYISMYSVCFLVCGVAAVVFPYRRRRFFESAPPLVQKRIAGVPLISIVGTGNVALFALVLYSALTNPGVSGVSGYMPTVVLIGVYGLGAVVYFSVPWIGRAAGGGARAKLVSPELLYEELPPD